MSLATLLPAPTDTGFGDASDGYAVLHRNKDEASDRATVRVIVHITWDGVQQTFDRTVTLTATAPVTHAAVYSENGVEVFRSTQCAGLQPGDVVTLQPV